MGEYGWRATMRRLLAALRSAHQALWDIAGLAGEDLDGDPTPRALRHPSVEEFAKDAVRNLRAAADEDGKRLAAAEAVCEAIDTEGTPDVEVHELLADWRALAHPTTAEPTRSDEIAPDGFLVGEDFPRLRITREEPTT